MVKCMWLFFGKIWSSLSAKITVKNIAVILKNDDRLWQLCTNYCSQYHVFAWELHFVFYGYQIISMIGQTGTLATKKLTTKKINRVCVKIEFHPFKNWQTKNTVTNFLQTMMLPSVTFNLNINEKNLTCDFLNSWLWSQSWSHVLLWSKLPCCCTVHSTHQQKGIHRQWSLWYWYQKSSQQCCSSSCSTKDSLSLVKNKWRLPTPRLSQAPNQLLHPHWMSKQPFKRSWTQIILQNQVKKILFSVPSARILSTTSKLFDPESDDSTELIEMENM